MPTHHPRKEATASAGISLRQASSMHRVAERTPKGLMPSLEGAHRPRSAESDLHLVADQQDAGRGATMGDLMHEPVPGTTSPLSDKSVL